MFRVLMYILLGVIGVILMCAYGCQVLASLDRKFNNQCLVDYPREINGCKIFYSNNTYLPPDYTLSFKGHKKYTGDDCVVRMRVTQKEYEDYINTR